MVISRKLKRVSASRLWRNDPHSALNWKPRRVYLLLFNRVSTSATDALWIEPVSALYIIVGLVMMGSFSSPRPSSTSNPPRLKNTSSSNSSKSQKSIVGFFQPNTTGFRPSVASTRENPKLPTGSSRRGAKSVPPKNIARSSSQSLTPAPSSDAINDIKSDEEPVVEKQLNHRRNGLPSPVTPLGGVVASPPVSNDMKMPLTFSSPSRKVWPCTRSARLC